VKRLREYYHLLIRLLLRLIVWLNPLISISLWLEPNLKNYVIVISKNVFHLLRRHWKTVEWVRNRFMMLYWLVDPLGFLRLYNWLLNISMEKNLINQSTLMKLLLMELLFRLLFLLNRNLEILKIYYWLMLLHCL